MRGFLAAVHAMGNGLVYVQPLSRTDPGFGGGIGAPGDPGYGHPEGPGWGGPVDPGWGNDSPVDPGYGRPGWGPADPGFGNRPPTDPGYGRPGGGHRPGNALPVPPPEGVVSPPIYLPTRPHLPAGAGVVVPLPEGASVPTPTEATPPGTTPHILWYGPGTQPSVVYLPPATPAAAPK